MAFIGNGGIKISYECSELINALKGDIEEFGDFVALVAVERRDGIDIFKDYNFNQADGNIDFKLKDGERVERIKAKDLLEIYETQNSII